MEYGGLPVIHTQVELLLPIWVDRLVQHLALVALAAYLELAVRADVCTAGEGGDWRERDSLVYPDHNLYFLNNWIIT